MNREWKAKAEIAEGAEMRPSGLHAPGYENEITDKVIGAAIEVHRHLGPGLLESAYEECLCFELVQLGLRFERQVPVPIVYKGLRLKSPLKLDLLVEDSVIVELKTADDLLPIHKAQLLTYLKASSKRVGLLINFNVPVLRNGLKRMVNRHVERPEKPENSASSAISSIDFHPAVSPRDLSDLCVSAVQEEAQ
jgi:GxxExxY protein